MFVEVGNDNKDMEQGNHGEEGDGEYDWVGAAEVCQLSCHDGVFVERCMVLVTP